MFRIFDLENISHSVLDSLAELANAVADRPAGSVLLEILDDMLGSPEYLPLIELDVQFAAERDALIHHLIS